MKIKKHDSDTLWLRTQIATGGLGKDGTGEKFEVAINIDNSCMIFIFPEATYTVSIHAMLEEVLAQRRQDLEGEGDEAEDIESGDEGSDEEVDV